MIERRTLSAALGDLLHGATERPLGVVNGPVPDAGKSYRDLLPYSILYPIPGASFADNFSGTAADISFSYQTTAVGGSYEQAEWLADRIRGALLDVARYPLSLPGVSIWARLPDTGPQQPTSDADELWSVAERFKVNVTTL